MTAAFPALIVLVGALLVAIPSAATVSPQIGRWFTNLPWFTSLTPFLIVIAVGVAFTVAGTIWWDLRERAAVTANSSGRWSRICFAGALVGQALALYAVFRVPAGNFAALGLVAGAVVLVAPLLLLALVCALISYRVAPRPRSWTHLWEMSVVVGVGLLLLTPAFRILGAYGAHVAR